MTMTQEEEEATYTLEDWRELAQDAEASERYWLQERRDWREEKEELEEGVEEWKKTYEQAKRYWLEAEVANQALREEVATLQQDRIEWKHRYGEEKKRADGLAMQAFEEALKEEGKHLPAKA